MATSDVCCARCVFAVNVSGHQVSWLTCHRRAPSPLPESTREQIVCSGVDGWWPRVSSRDYCGDFKARADGGLVSWEDPFTFGGQPPAAPDPETMARATWQPRGRDEPAAYNGSGTPCDMNVGVCQCGAFHHSKAEVDAIAAASSTGGR